MINTYNESALHKKLKEAASDKYKGKTEQRVGQYICDVLTKDGKIIEIQTSSFKNISAKLACLLQTRSVHLIYPLAVNTYIEYYDENGRILSRRKSPVKRDIYHIFDELISLPQIILNDNFTLEVAETVIVKKRKRTEKPIQSANGKRRHKKNWYALDTDIESIEKSSFFYTLKDYRSLLPAELPEEFTAKDIRKYLALQSKGNRQINEMLWLFRKLGFVERAGKAGRCYLYRIK